MSDILKDTKKFDKLQASMEVDVTPKDNGIPVKEALKKEKEDVGKFDLRRRNIGSISWKPDKSFDKVPLEKLNPFVYSQGEMEDFRAEHQSLWNKWLGAPVKFTTMAATTFLDNTVGFVVGAANALAENSGHGFVDNWFSRAMQGVQNSVDKEFALYMTREDQEKPWYRQLGTANWWIDTIASQGFTAGVVASAALWGGLLTKGVSSIAAFRMGKGLTYLPKSKDLAKIPQAFKAGQVAPDIAKKAIIEAGKSLRIADYGVKTVAGMQGSASYARTEAMNHAQQLSEELMFKETQSWDRDKENISQEVRSEILAENPGIPINELEVQVSRRVSDIKQKREENLSELIRKHTNRTFVKDLAYLTLTSNLMFGKLFSGNYGLQREAARRLIKPKAGWGAVASDRRALGKGIENASAKSIKAKDVAGALTKNPAVQFFEESFLHINRESSGDYTKMAYDPETMDELGDYTKSYFTKIADTFGDIDEWESGMRGFFGALLGAAGPVRSSGKRMGYTMSGGIWDAMRAMKQDAGSINETLINQANKYLGDEKRQAFEEYLIRNSVTNKKTMEAVEADDPFSFENEQATDLANAFVLFDELGMTQEFMEYITSGLDISPQQAREAFALKGDKVENKEDLDVFSKLDDSEVSEILSQEATRMRDFGKSMIELKQNIDVLANQRGLSREVRNEIFHLAASLENMGKRATDSKSKLAPGVAVVADEILDKAGSIVGKETMDVTKGDEKFTEAMLGVLSMQDGEQGTSLAQKLDQAIKEATTNEVERDALVKELNNYMSLNARINRFSDLYKALKSDQGVKDLQAKVDTYKENLNQFVEKKFREEAENDIRENSDGEIFRKIDDEEALYRGKKVGDDVYLEKWNPETGKFELTEEKLTPDNIDDYVKNTEKKGTEDVSPQVRKELLDRIHNVKTSEKLIDMVYGDLEGMYITESGMRKPSIRSSNIKNKAPFIEAARKRYKELTNKEAPKDFAKEKRYVEFVYMNEAGEKFVTIFDYEGKKVYVHDYNDFIKVQNKKMTQRQLWGKQKTLRNINEFDVWRQENKVERESMFFQNISEKAVIKNLENLLAQRDQAINSLQEKSLLIQDKILDFLIALETPMGKYKKWEAGDKRINFEKARAAIEEINLEIAILYEELEPVAQQLKELESQRAHFAERLAEESGKESGVQSNLETIISEYDQEIKKHKGLLDSYNSFLRNVVDFIKRVRQLFKRVLEKREGVPHVKGKYKPGEWQDLTFDQAVREIEMAIREDFSANEGGQAVDSYTRWQRLNELMNTFKELTSEALKGEINEAQAIAQQEKLAAAVKSASVSLARTIREMEKKKALLEEESANYAHLRDRMVNEVTPVSQGTIATKKKAASPADKVYTKDDALATSEEAHKEEESFWKNPRRYLSRVFKVLAGNSLAKDDSQTRYFRFVNNIHPSKLKELRGRVVPLRMLKSKQEMDKILKMYPDGNHYAVVIVNKNGNFVSESGDPIAEGGIPIESIDTDKVRAEAIYTTLPTASLQNQNGDDKFFTPDTDKGWLDMYPRVKTVEEAKEAFEAEKQAVVQEHNALLQAIQETLDNGENFEIPFVGKTLGVEIKEAVNQDGTTSSGYRSVSSVLSITKAGDVQIQVFTNKELAAVKEEAENVSGESLRRPGFVYVVDNETGNTFKAKPQKINDKNPQIIENIISLFAYYTKQLSESADTSGKVDSKGASLIEVPGKGKVSIFELVSNYLFWTGDNLTAEGKKELNALLADGVDSDTAYKTVFSNPKNVVNSNISTRFHWKENSNVPGGELVIGQKVIPLLDNNGQLNLALENELRNFLKEAYFQVRKPLLSQPNNKFHHIKNVNPETGSVETEVFNTYEDFLISDKYSPIALNNSGKYDKTAADKKSSRRVTHENQNIIFNTDSVVAKPETKPYNKQEDAKKEEARERAAELREEGMEAIGEGLKKMETLPMFSINELAAGTYYLTIFDKAGKELDVVTMTNKDGMVEWVDDAHTDDINKLVTHIFSGNVQNKRGQVVTGISEINEALTRYKITFKKKNDDYVSTQETAPSSVVPKATVIKDSNSFTKAVEKQQTKPQGVSKYGLVSKGKANDKRLTATNKSDDHNIGRFEIIDESNALYHYAAVTDIARRDTLNRFDLYVDGTFDLVNNKGEAQREIKAETTHLTPIKPAKMQKVGDMWEVVERGVVSLDGPVNEKYYANEQTAATSKDDDLAVRTKSSGNYKGTENFREMKAWWEERFPGITYDRSLHNLRRWLEENHTVDFERLYDIVANKSWGAFYGAAVYISDNAEAGTTYHEAFHVVTQLFLSEKERSDIYNELRENLGNKEVSVGLEYMLTGKALDVSPKNKSFFQKLKSILKNIVGKLRSMLTGEAYTKDGEKIMTLFRKIEQNDLPPMKTDVSSDVFANTKFEQEFVSDNPQYKSPEFFAESMRSMDYYLTSSLVRNPDRSIFDLFTGVKTTELYDTVLKDLKAEMRKSNVPEHKQALRFLIDNWDKQVVYQHRRHLKQYGIEEVTEDVINEGVNETDRGRDSGGIVPQSSLKLSSKHTASNVVKLMLSTLPLKQFNSQGKAEHVRGKRTGLVQASEFGQLFNILSDRLSNIKTLGDMLSEVKRISFVDPTYAGIPKVLKTGSGNNVDANTALLRVQFHQAFHKDSTNYSYNIFDGESTAKTNDATLEGVRKTIAQEFEQRQAERGSLDEKGKYKEGLFELSKQERMDVSIKKGKELIDLNNKIAQRELRVYGIDVNFDSPLLTEAMKKEARGRLLAMKRLSASNIYTGNNHENIKFFVEFKKQSDLRYIETSSINLNGDRVHHNTLYNYMTTVIEDIVSPKMTVNQLFEKYPHLRQSVYLRKDLKNIRAEKGWQGIPSLRMVIDQGVYSPTDFSRVEASKLFKADRLKLRIESAFQDKFPMLQPGDNSVSRYLYMEGINELASPENFNILVREYLLQELGGITNTNDIKSFANFQENYNQGIMLNVAMGTHKGLPAEIQKLYNGNYEGTADQAVRDLMDRFWDSAFKPNIKRHFDSITENLLTDLMENGLVTEKDGKYSFNNVYPPSRYRATIIKTQNLSKEKIKELLLQVQQLSFASTMEQFRMFYGDARAYKFDKLQASNVLTIFQRLSGAVGTKTLSTVDSGTNFFVNNHMKGINGNIPAEHNGSPVIRTMTVEDAIVADSRFLKRMHESYNVDSRKDKQAVLKALVPYGSMELAGKLLSYADYEKLTDKKKAEVIIKGMEEPDGGSWVSLDEWRWLKFRNGDWGFGENSLDALYQWERYIHEGVDVSERFYVDPYTGEKSKEVINPSKLPVANSLKPQYFGPTTEGKITMFKTSLMPLLPSVIGKNTTLSKLHDFMVENNIGIVANKSANKGVTTKLTEKGMHNRMYNDEGMFGINEDFVTQEIYYDHMGLQLSTGNKTKNTVVTGTQMMKQMLSNLFVFGKPVNERFEGYKNRYFKLNEMRLSNSKTVLKEKLGLREVEKDGKITYRFGDLDTFIDRLMEEAQNREVSNNVLSAIALIRQRATIDHLPTRNQIENILNGLADATVISRKRRGGAYYQQPSTGMEVFNVTRSDVTLGGKTFKASDLEFNQREDGSVSTMEVYISDMYQGKVKPGDDLTKFVAFRIPTQGLNSIEAIIVKGFLPSTAGELIIMPSAIVAKAGSDYDIDKLNIYIPNSYRASDGGYVLIDPSQGVDSQYTEYLEHFSETANKKKLLSFVEDAFKEKPESQKRMIIKAINSLEQKTPEALIEYMEIVLASREAEKERYDFRGWGTTTVENSIALANEVIEALQDRMEGQEFTFIGEPMSKAEFTVKHTENAISNLQREIILDPDNYEQLTTPNSSHILSGIAREIQKLKGKDGKADDLSRLSDITFLADITERYMVADGAIGIAALASTFHIMAQLEGLKIGRSFEYGPSRALINTKIRLQHNKDENGKIQLGGAKDASGEYRISEILSQWINAAVDVKKDPFMFDYNANRETLPVILYLISAGVPIKTVGYFMNQPIIEHYLKQKAAYKSVTAKSAKTNKSDNDILKEIFKIEKYGKLNLSDVSDRVVTQGFLESRLGKSGEFTQEDLQVLRDFRRYELTAGKMRDAIQGITYDTHSLGNTVAEAVLRLRSTKAIIDEGLFENYNNLVNSGFIKPYKESIESIKDSYFTFYEQTRDDVARELFDHMVDLYFDAPISMEQKVKVLNKFKLEFINYNLINHRIPDALGTMKGKRLSDPDVIKVLIQSAGNKLSAKKQQIENGESVIGESLFRALVPVRNEFKSTEIVNIRPVERKLTALEENAITDSWRELYDTDITLANELFYLAVIQGAHLASPNNYINWVPSEVYNNFAKDMFYEQSRRPAQEKQADYNKFFVEFFLKNYEDNDIVPYGYVKKNKNVTDGIDFIETYTLGGFQFNPLASRMPFVKEWKRVQEKIDDKVIGVSKAPKPTIFARLAGNNTIKLPEIEGVQDHKRNMLLSGFGRIFQDVKDIVDKMPFFKAVPQNTKQVVRERIEGIENLHKLDEGNGKLFIMLPYPLESGAVYETENGNLAKLAGFESLQDMKNSTKSEQVRDFANGKRGIYGAIASKYTVLSSLSTTESAPRSVVQQTTPDVQTEGQKSLPDALYGLRSKNLTFKIETLDKINRFTEALGVPIVLETFGESYELALANFDRGVIQIAEDLDKRADAWNKLPEEAAHWWYRLLKSESSLKDDLWNAHETMTKANELYKTKYGEKVNRPEDLREEAIGQIIAETIQKIEDGTATEQQKTLWQKIVEFIKSFIKATKEKSTEETPFTLAAQKIINSDLSELLSLEEYRSLFSISEEVIEVVEAPSKDSPLIESPNEYFENLLNGKYKKRTRYLPKTIQKLAREMVGSPLQKEKFSEEQIDLIKKKSFYKAFAPSLKSYDGLRKKFKTQKISLNSPIKVDGIKSQELQILNDVREAIKKENPELKSIEVEEFINEVRVFLSENYKVGFSLVHGWEDYRVIDTFEDKSARHVKIALRFNDEYIKQHSHFRFSPIAWANYTPFGDNGVLIHEIQNDFIERLRDYEKKSEGTLSAHQVIDLLNYDYFLSSVIANILQGESNDGVYESFKAVVSHGAEIASQIDTIKQKDAAYKKQEDFYTARDILRGILKRGEHKLVTQEQVNTYKQLVKGFEMFAYARPEEVAGLRTPETPIEHKRVLVNDFIERISSDYSITPEIKTILTELVGSVPFFNAGYVNKTLLSEKKAMRMQAQIKQEISFANAAHARRIKFQELSAMSKDEFFRLTEHITHNVNLLVDATKGKIKGEVENQKKEFTKELLYFTPLIHHTLQTAIANNPGKPLYFSGYDIALLSQVQIPSKTSQTPTADLYAGPEDVKQGKAKAVGAMWANMNKVDGIKLKYVENIPGFTKQVSGYEIDVSNYKHKSPILFGLDMRESSDQSVSPTKSGVGLGNIKPGVQDIFESNPELANIGTQQQYSQYLDTIFPDSKVKDIVYHGTNSKFDKFNKSNLPDSGIYFDKNKTTAYGYGNVLISAILNSSGYYYGGSLNRVNSKQIRENGETGLTNGSGNIVFEPEQIHILGSKQDIEGFKEFVQLETSLTSTPDMGTKPLGKPSRETFRANKLKLSEIAQREATIEMAMENFEMLFPSYTSMSTEERRAFLESMDTFEFEC